MDRWTAGRGTISKGKYVFQPASFRGYSLVFGGVAFFWDAKGSRVCEFFSVDEESKDTKSMRLNNATVWKVCDILRTYIRDIDSMHPFEWHSLHTFFSSFSSMQHIQNESYRVWLVTYSAEMLGHFVEDSIIKLPFLCEWFPWVITMWRLIQLRA